MTLPISGKRLASTVRQDFNFHSPPLVVSQSYTEQSHQAPIPWENRSSGTSTRQSAELKEFLSSLPRLTSYKASYQSLIIDFQRLDIAGT